MSVHGKATLRLLDKADKQIRALPRPVKGAIYDFQYRFRENPATPGLQFKRLQGHDLLYSARVTSDYRALILHAGDNDYILVGVRARQDVYDNLDRFRTQINEVTGAIEFLEIVPSTEIDAQPPETAAVPVAAPEPESAPPSRPTAPANAPDTPQSMFAHIGAEGLRELGVTEVLIPSAMAVDSEETLLRLIKYAPSMTEEVLLALADGKGFDEVLEQITRPVAVPEPVDTSDFGAALRRPATRVSTEDTDLQDAIEDPFNRWKVFLHPAQRKLVRRSYKGPARVSGGPGTGKTIVALHRVKYLVEQLPPAKRKQVLLTTFTTNLVADLRKRLLELGGQELVDRVDIVNIDKLASRIVTEAALGGRRRRINDLQATDEWRDMLVELGETSWDAEFLSAEWNQVILGQGIATRSGYFRARRAGRGQRISRAQRARIWELVERFTMRLNEKGVWTYRQVAETAARVKAEQAAKIEENRRREEEHGAVFLHRQEQSWAGLRYDYEHIVVDEAQDLSPAHWTLLRAMVAERDDDIFLVGDTHQRIYDNHVSLSSLGVNIRGRSSRLTLSYRTTRQILGSAMRLLGDESWDDMDDQSDDLAGYRSVLTGPPLRFLAAATPEEELDTVAEVVSGWHRRYGDEAAVAVAAPTKSMVGEVQRRLLAAGLRSVTIGSDAAEDSGSVHVGTLHRFKGLEYRHVLIAGAADGIIPRAAVTRLRDADPLRYRRELQKARSLLFVAATRARDALVIAWSGTPSPFLPQDTESVSSAQGGGTIDGALFAPDNAMF
ncbi:UvrD-like helicase family protein [Murinocardiopsis flavida]|uniref:DNA 3'-5' helicase n=1 Tax=Murinocardiopsis flavida TaxID=645275 RepID=A0A2P8DP60_9ACTN|nr:UvrD-helicase domain-containing protein [Murinocardiopsis flavida]PSK99012.1 UvrD-like helicase family protein [Murinocardiopsis flavida]